MLLLILFAVVVGYVVQPFVAQVPAARAGGFRVATAESADVLSAVLGAYDEVIGDDVGPYRGHCLRVLSYAKHFLKEDEAWADADIAAATDVLEAAIAYHDIALWTDGALDYLAPSAAKARSDLAPTANFTPEQLQAIDDIIMWHHKLTPWEGPNAALVNAVRKADWIDFSGGLTRLGSAVSAGAVRKAVTAIPCGGFHAMLAGMGPRLSPDSWKGQLEVLKIIKW
uniref:HD domain-containing protein n=1 Tax=Phaeomonas parva TaxID=124430 RepID=A0A7S1UEL7_9STRA|mmetsp:Transcript_44546/g.139727  ORF Transcript_44546/g.139727 Transcript_44546/m.139727 type:complete len:226 (+) Transcript_44546:92-769(+)